MQQIRNTSFIFALICFFLIPIYAAADTLGQRQQFFVNSQYDANSRQSINATLRNISDHAYMYVDDLYWSNLSSANQNRLSDAVVQLGTEFENVIYPRNTKYWGSEPNPGIDNDPKMVIVLENMKSGFGGYFDSTNNYAISQAPTSNERDMVFLNAGSLLTSQANVFLAHEFQHLISFNQKEEINKVVEDTWLNETRSEYTAESTGYNTSLAEDQVLSRRVDAFKATPSDSLTEWPNLIGDYAQAALFGRYIAGHYPGILNASLKSPLIGIPSLNEFLSRNGYSEKFENVFGNWALANYLNTPTIDARFTYKQDILKNIHVAPSRVSSISEGTQYNFSYSIGPWQAYWHVVNTDANNNKPIKISSDGFVKIMYSDNLGRSGIISNPAYVTNPGDLREMILIPFHDRSGNQNFSLSVAYTDEDPVSMFSRELKDGMLIRRQGEPEIYVIEGKYKRYLRPEIIRLYGHLDANKVVTLDPTTFNIYVSANYVRYVNDQKAYAVWPDGTKHWLHMSAKTFSDSSRDWNSIFIINDLELNSYKTGPDITK